MRSPMRLFLLLFPALLFAQTDVSGLAWFAGCWEMRSPSGLSIEEQWMKPAGGVLLGMGRTIRGGKVLDTEFLRISIENGKLTYTGRIGTAGVTRFPLLKITDGEVVFENAAHDFPQRIIYRKQGGSLFARVEGIEKGKPRHQDFPYVRAACG
jgi:Domain of unknown function (DUF6265)